MSVVDLEAERLARKPVWQTDFVLCDGCGRTWVAVHPSCAGNLECPECGELAGKVVSETVFRCAQTAQHNPGGNVVQASNRFRGRFRQKPSGGT